MGKAYYMLATAPSTKELTMIVQTMLELGWQLAGGVAVFGFPGGREYTQALYRPPEATPAVAPPADGGAPAGGQSPEATP